MFIKKQSFIGQMACLTTLAKSNKERMIEGFPGCDTDWSWELENAKLMAEDWEEMTVQNV